MKECEPHKCNVWHESMNEDWFKDNLANLYRITTCYNVVISTYDIMWCEDNVECKRGWVEAVLAYLKVPSYEQIRQAHAKFQTKYITNTRQKQFGMHIFA
jgi:hypothetical protein